MFQRKQSLFLIVLLLINLFALAFVPVWVAEGQEVYILDAMPLTLFEGAICAAALAALIQFKARPRQLAMNRLNLLLNLLYLAFLLFNTYSPQSGMVDALQTGSWEMGNAGFLPLINIVLLYLANKGIQKDEDLIKSVDRIR